MRTISDGKECAEPLGKARWAMPYTLSQNMCRVLFPAAKDIILLVEQIDNTLCKPSYSDMMRAEKELKSREAISEMTLNDER